MRIVRVELDSGQRLVGLRYPEQLIPEATLFLKEQKGVDTVLVSMIYSFALCCGKTYSVAGLQRGFLFG